MRHTRPKDSDWSWIMSRASRFTACLAAVLALAGRARILLLDEPLTGLDPRQRALVKRLLERLMRARVTMIIAGHHPEDLPRGMTHGLRLHRGRAYFTDCDSAT